MWTKQNFQTSLDLGSAKWKKLYQDYKGMPAGEECDFSCAKPFKEVSELKMYQIEAGLQTEFDISRSGDGSLDGNEITINEESSCCLSPFGVVSPDYHQDVTCRDGKQEDGMTSSVLGNILPIFSDGTANVSMASGVSDDYLNIRDDILINQELGRSFLRSCSSERNLVHGRKSSASDGRFEFGGENVRTKRKWVDYGIMTEEMDLVIFGKDLHSGGTPKFQSSSMIQYDLHEKSELSVKGSVNSCLVLKNNLPDSSRQVSKCSSHQRSSRSGRSPIRAEQTTGINFRNDDDDAMYENLIEGCSEFEEDTIRGYATQKEDEDLTYSNLYKKEDWERENRSYDFSPDHKGCSVRKRKIGEIHLGDLENLFSPELSKRFSEVDWSRLPSYNEESHKNYAVSSFYDTPLTEHECRRPDSRSQEIRSNRKKSSIRSHSAPPSYKGKKRYLNLTDSCTMLSVRSNFQNISTTSTDANNSSHAESKNLNRLQNSYGQNHPSATRRFEVDCLISRRPSLEMTPQITRVQNGESQKKDQSINMEAVECVNLKKIRDSSEAGWKWRNCCLPTAGGSTPHNNNNHDTILDISSDILHFAGDSLVPKSIDRASLEFAKVLNQVDKKFIAVVAGENLSIIDQHAADERIRLEELRHKVLSGEMKTITYLDDEQDLVLPEIGYQLLHNYAEQIQIWGWICNIHSQDTSSFTKHLDLLHRKSTVVKLLAVPCILGVNLTDTDLLEFLQQLADTDGSSTIPPSVRRVLNSKACRGAIMFGDTLLPSECSLIVEELKLTSLCFQCAHGRPTTVPLVNLALLHNKIAKLGSDESWHGLRQHKLSLKRTAQRLSAALC